MTYEFNVISGVMIAAISAYNDHEGDTRNSYTKSTITNFWVSDSCCKNYINIKTFLSYIMLL